MTVSLLNTGARCDRHQLRTAATATPAYSSLYLYLDVAVCDQSTI